jgi:hypothetical protein
MNSMNPFEAPLSIPKKLTKRVQTKGAVLKHFFVAVLLMSIYWGCVTFVLEWIQPSNHRFTLNWWMIISLAIYSPLVIAGIYLEKSTSNYLLGCLCSVIFMCECFLYVDHNRMSEEHLFDFYDRVDLLMFTVMPMVLTSTMFVTRVILKALSATCE